MGLDAIKELIPDYAKDIKLNLSSLVSEEILTTQQLWGCFVACAITGRNQQLTREILNEAAEKIEPQALSAASSAAAIMGMNNVYYKFVGMAANTEYKGMPARLRMSVLGNPGVDKGDFELWTLAVSAMNGCKYCVDAHEAQAKAQGVSSAAIQTVIRIAAVVSSVSMILDTTPASVL